MDEWYEVVEHIANKAAVLAFDSAAKDMALTDREVSNAIEVYVEKRIPELKIRRGRYYIKQIVVPSLDDIKYIERQKGILCSTREQVICDLVKRSYRNGLHRKREFSEVLYESVKDYMISYGQFSYDAFKSIESSLNKKYVKVLKRYANIVIRRVKNYLSH